MQDFTKSPKVTDSNTALANKEEKWLTKDRFWNFVFWFGMSLGLSIAHFIRTNLHMADLAKIMYIITLLGIPLLLLLFNRTKLIKPLVFANSEGKILMEEQRPYLVLPAVLAGIAITTLLDIGFDSFRLGDNRLKDFFIFVSIFSGISLYFIFKNCPISILFNPKFWTVDGHPNIALLRKVKKNINED